MSAAARHSQTNRWPVTIAATWPAQSVAAMRPCPPPCTTQKRSLLEGGVRERGPVSTIAIDSPTKGCHCRVACASEASVRPARRMPRMKGEWLYKTSAHRRLSKKRIPDSPNHDALLCRLTAARADHARDEAEQERKVRHDVHPSGDCRGGNQKRLAPQGVGRLGT